MKRLYLASLLFFAFGLSAQAEVLPPLSGIAFSSATESTLIETWSVEPEACSRKRYGAQVHFSCAVKEGGVLAFFHNGERVALEVTKLEKIELDAVPEESARSIFKYHAVLTIDVAGMQMEEPVVLVASNNQSEPDRITGSLKILRLGVVSPVIMRRK